MPRHLTSPQPSRKVARGHANAAGTLKRCVIAFDDETFDAIAQEAKRRNVSFAAMVRELVEFGMETDHA